ncbi:hypothetical protein CR956_00845 [Candidatus Saccharibacteria bacterium]|nr:MAG: hypothetical protein CR956_00845 [Candidatus Saccharibacteria bacterium]
MKLTKIIGVAGTNGSGKDTLGDLLAAEKDYINVSLSDILRAELDKQGKLHTRENLSGVSRRIRETEGDGSMSKRVINQYRESERGLCITSIRAPGEAAEIQQSGGIVVWVYADEHIRYERIRSAKRGRGETDIISFEEFLRQEAAEMTPTEQGGGLNMEAVKNRADIHLKNEFSSLEAYQDYLRDYFEF